MISRSDRNDSLSYIPSIFHAWTGTYEGYSWLLRQDYVSVDLDRINRETGLTPWNIQILPGKTNVSLILEALSDHKIAPEIVESKDPLNRSMLFLTLYVVCDACFKIMGSDVEALPEFGLTCKLIK